jgi:hypothetical protein
MNQQQKPVLLLHLLLAHNLVGMVFFVQGCHFSCAFPHACDSYCAVKCKEV